MKGHPGTGKSTLVLALARRLGWPLLDKDDVKDHTLALADGNGLAYTILWQRVETQLCVGLSVIADTPLSYPQSYATVCQLATHYEASLLVVETRLDESIWKARLDTRAEHDSAHKISGWQTMQALLKRYDGCWDYPIDPAHHVIVDMHDSTEELVDRVAKWTEDERGYANH